MSESADNEIRVKRLISIGAIWPELLEEIADLLESEDSESRVACFFQLPYALRLSQDWHRVRASQEDKTLYLYLQARTARLECDEFARLAVREVIEEAQPQPSNITQIICLVPLWGRRSRYYSEYLRAVSVDESGKRTVVSGERWKDRRPVTARAYEFDLAQRLPRLISSGLRLLLPAYSICSLVEAPAPNLLSNFFVMPAPGRVIFNRPPQPVLGALLSKNTDSETVLVSSLDLGKSLKVGVRELGKFEHQLLAMNRLRLSGERALALIGTLSLLEWYLNLRFPADSPKQESVEAIIISGRVNFLPKECRVLLREASNIRNGLVHGAPPVRHRLTETHNAAGRERDYQGNLVPSEKVEEIIRTALEVFRLSNLQLRNSTNNSTAAS